MAKKETNPSMAPEEYREFLRQVDLESIVLDSCSVKTDRQNIGSNMKLDVRPKVTYVIEEETSATISVSYELLVTQTTRKEYSLKLECVYQVALSSKLPMTDSFMEIYTRVNIQMNMWPYFREFVQNMLQRVGFPPLTLPLLKP
ncbi:MAG: hypothetical protein ACOC23_09145 [Thermodesulfobacteriota bacterium]